MKNNIYKKLLSFITLIALLSWNLLFTFNASALETLQVQPTLQVVQPVTTLQTVGLQDFTAVQPVYTPKVILEADVWSFHVNTKTLLNKEVLELFPITSSNAWDVLKTWTVDSTFNKNFVIKPVWTDYDFLVMKLDEKGLNEALEKTNLAKSTYSQYKWVTWWLWTLEIETPVMQRLPDRLVLTSKTRIKFKTKAEFDNIKQYYKLDWDLIIHQALPTKTKATIWTIAWKLDLDNNGRIEWEGTELSSFDSNDLLGWLYNDCLTDSGCKEKLAGELWIDASDFFTTVKLRPIKRPYNPKTDDKALEEMFISNLWESVIEQVEKIEISLLPVDPLSTDSFHNNLRILPELVRISSNEINAVFLNIQKIAIIWQALEEVEETVDPANEVEEICNSYTWTEKTACLKLAESYVDPKSKTYEKILINGITLWNEYNYNFNSSWKKKFSRWFGSKTITIYSVDVNLSFGYGFGLRVPIKVKIDINKDAIKVNASSTEKKIKATVTVKTIDATAQEYSEAWIHSTQIFDWQEFVFKLYAFLDWKLVLANKTVFDKRYDLIMLLWELLQLEWLRSFDESENFVAPFAWEHTFSLFSEEYWIKVYKKNYSLWGWTIFADLLFNAYIDWHVTAECVWINVIWSSCNKIIDFNTIAPKILELTPMVNSSNQQEDLLWEYNNYWIILKDFKYIPQLVASIKSRARLNYWYDFKVRDGKGDIYTPRYEIYKFTLDLPALWAHVWYWADWTYTLTPEQKQIKATDNKIYSKLKSWFAWVLLQFYPMYIWFLNLVEVTPIDWEDDDSWKIYWVNDFIYQPKVSIDDFRTWLWDVKFDFWDDVPTKICTMDAKICPDGSSVGRTWPNCEFTECPTRPQICTMEYMPVCWEKDWEKKTYWNRCMHDAAGATLVNIWKCITPDEEVPDEWTPDEEVSVDEEWNNWWNPLEEIFDDWIQDDWSTDDSVVNEVVAEVLNKYLKAANGLAWAWVINDNSDNPDGYNFASTIFRNEAAKVAVNLDPSISMKLSCNKSFADVNTITPNTWTCGYAEALLDAGKISANTKFNPLSRLTKAEATKMMLEAAGCTNVYTNAAFWQAEVAAFAAWNWLINNFTDYNTYATRAFVFEIADAARLFCD